MSLFGLALCFLEPELAPFISCGRQLSTWEKYLRIGEWHATMGQAGVVSVEFGADGRWDNEQFELGPFPGGESNISHQEPNPASNHADRGTMPRSGIVRSYQQQQERFAG